MSQLAALVSTSMRVGAMRARLTKTRELAEYLRTLAPDVERGDWRDRGTRTDTHIIDTHRRLDEIAGLRGTGSAARRSEALRELFALATRAEQEFLVRLLVGELRQGALDPATGTYVMLGKTFKGLTDAMLEWQTAELFARQTRSDHYTVYVRPELVAEIAFSDLQASPRYPGGVALRLARVKRYREDKSAAEADTMVEVRRIFEAQW